MGIRKMYNTTLDADLIREIKVLAARLLGVGGVGGWCPTARPTI